MMSFLSLQSLVVLIGISCVALTRSENAEGYQCDSYVALGYKFCSKCPYREAGIRYGVEYLPYPPEVGDILNNCATYYSCESYNISGKQYVHITPYYCPGLNTDSKPSTKDYLYLRNTGCVLRNTTSSIQHPCGTNSSIPEPECPEPSPGYIPGCAKVIEPVPESIQDSPTKFGSDPVTPADPEYTTPDIPNSTTEASPELSPEPDAYSTEDHISTIKSSKSGKDKGDGENITSSQTSVAKLETKLAKPRAATKKGRSLGRSVGSYKRFAYLE